MIKTWTDETYPTDDEWNMPEFKRYPFELDNFQKYAIRATSQNDNVLVISQTGSGKTICAEFAILQAIAAGKKVIYTSPIKSLSNQKFNEFNKKFGDNRVGILTGDIKYNADAPILIMTTEILRNLLYKDNIQVNKNMINLDIKKDVAAVIFDEVHYINDKDRGKIWEECIILLPKEIQLIMLSATINKAEEFGQWIVAIKEKNLHIVGNKKRVIPLKHYYYMTMKGINNKANMSMDKEEKKFIDKHINQLIPILDENGKFFQENVSAIHRIQKKYSNMIEHNGVINNMIQYLEEKKMLPAIFFIFSRNKCEQYAEMVNITLNTPLEQHEVEKTFDFYISKLDNKDSYLKLSQYHKIKKLLKRGIGFHHSGLVPVFKEITEILFDKHLVKVLMATETFAVGINMPTKTAVFTSLVKYDSGEKFRILKTAEYMQMSGRAGRRGMDTIGYVIHLPNLNEYPSMTEVKQMMLGHPQSIESKFMLNYQFILKAIITDGLDLKQIIRASLWNTEIDKELANLQQQLIEHSTPAYALSQSDYQKCEIYDSLLNEVSEFGIKYSHNAIKMNHKKAQKMMSDTTFKQIYNIYKSVSVQVNDRKDIESNIEFSKSKIDAELHRILLMLLQFDYIKLPTSGNIMDITKTDVTIKGIMASQVNQCQELFLVEMIYHGIFKDLAPEEIIAVLSIFSDTKTSNTKNTIPNNKIKNAIDQTIQIGEQLWTAEDKLSIRLNSNWEIINDLVDISYNWAKNNEMIHGDIIFEGEFIKEMIKIGHIAEDLEMLCDILQDNHLKSIVAQINPLIIKEVVCVDSLYIKNTR